LGALDYTPSKSFGLKQKVTRRSESLVNWNVSSEGSKQTNSAYDW